MVSLDLQETKVELYHRLLSLASQNARMTQITQDRELLLFHAGYHAALEDMAKACGISIPKSSLPVVVK